MDNLKKGSVLILDFGSQYTQLIARRVRENYIFSEVLPPSTTLKTIMRINPKAIILSGGPSSVISKNAPIFDKNILSLDIPILGICYGLHLLVHHNGGKVTSGLGGEYGFAEVTFSKTHGITKNMSPKSKVWMSHMDQVTSVPENWEVVSRSSNGVIAALINEDQSRIATQFHPEVSHTEEGGALLKNFLFIIANCEKNWTPNNFIDEQIKNINSEIKKDNILVGVSGGVDSTVMACMINNVVGKRCYAVLIDHGLLRKNEAKQCVDSLRDGLGINIHLYDESEIFFSRLKGVVEPEKKRKIIGDQFIQSFDRIADEIGEYKFLGQGTLYPDLIESGVSASNSSHLIKSHHNVGGLPKNLKFK
ncbi:MAG: glutamine-hydrolyzing GMP synthase, partial [Candidatus Marinimicrobia bacterium]|nr:glutamine-hydrolyzing GMP synthase [Candidatus Neomarinimicrobiota bacterium]